MVNARRPRVVIASRLYDPEVTAAAFRITALARALAADADVDVVTTRPPAEAPAPRSIEGVRVSRARVLRDRNGAIRGYLSYASFDAPAFFRMLFRRADAIVAEAPPTTGFVALVVARLKRIPLVYYPGDVWTDAVIAMGASKPVVGIMRWMESTVVRRAGAVLAVSPEVRERFVDLGAAGERVHLIGNGIDTEVFTPDGEAAKTERPYFVYTGTMSEWQRPEIFIRALERLGDEAVELRFFGQGSVEGELRRLAEELVPGRVRFGGVVDPAATAEWIRGAAGALVSIAPGLGYDLARPTKTYAAAACGTPVLFAGADTGGEVVRDGELGEAVGFDPDEVAGAMRLLLAERGDGTTERRRRARSAWVRENASLEAVGRRAARLVLAALPSALRPQTRHESENRT